MKVKKKTGPKIRRCGRCRRTEDDGAEFYKTGGYCKACSREISSRNYRRRRRMENKTVRGRSAKREGVLAPGTAAREAVVAVQGSAEVEAAGRREIDTLLLRVIERLLHYGPRRAAEILPGIEAALPEEGQAELAALKRAIQVIAAVKGRWMREESF